MKQIILKISQLLSLSILILLNLTSFSKTENNNVKSQEIFTPDTIYSEIEKLKLTIEKHGSSLKVIHSNPLEGFQQLVNKCEIHAVFTNKDYEPYSIQRDKNIEIFLRKAGINFLSFKDHVTFEEGKLLPQEEAFPWE